MVVVDRMMGIRSLFLACGVFFGVLPLWGSEGDGDLRMNQIQVIGTHNSYHVRPPDFWYRQIRKIRPDAKAWDYTHAPLDVQLDRGVRSFEIDVHNYPDGFRSFHAPFDMGTTCGRFVDCLEVVRGWSKAHPGHVPISFLVEIKDEAVILATTPAQPIDEAALDRLDAEVRAVFPPEKLITPDDVRGDAPTLEEAVLTRGWPRLDAVRGRVLVILHEGGDNRELFCRGRPSLEGRAMFVRSAPGRADAAALVVDRPDAARIEALVRKGYYVRTRVDAGLRQQEGRPERAFSSGAHILSTDFPPGEPYEANGYVVAFDGGRPARCNPVNAPADCDGALLEPEADP